MVKINFIFDKTNKSLNFKKKILRKYKFSIKQSDFIVVAGGDGFMLQTIKKIINLINLLWNKLWFIWFPYE